MKKIIAVFSVFFALAAGTCFAASDIQIKIGINAYSTPVDNDWNFSVSAHQFFGETQTFGIAEGFIGESWGAHLFLGPAFGFNLLESLRLQVSTGLKWGISAYNGTENDTDWFLGDSNNFLWGNDIQLKMTADRFLSFLIGVQMSAGAVIVKKTADENAKNFDWYFDVTPYVGLSFNLRGKTE